MRAATTTTTTTTAADCCCCCCCSCSAPASAPAPAAAFAVNIPVLQLQCYYCYHDCCYCYYYDDDDDYYYYYYYDDFLRPLLLLRLLLSATAVRDKLQRFIKHYIDNPNKALQLLLFLFIPGGRNGGSTLSDLDVRMQVLRVSRLYRHAFKLAGGAANCGLCLNSNRSRFPGLVLSPSRGVLRRPPHLREPP